MDNEFLQERIDKLKQQITAYDLAIDSLSSGVQEYTLDTGQNVQKVKIADISMLNKSVDQMLNRLSILEARCGNSRTVIARPGF